MEKKGKKTRTMTTREKRKTRRRKMGRTRRLLQQKPREGCYKYSRSLAAWRDSTPPVPSIFPSVYIC